VFDQWSTITLSMRQIQEIFSPENKYYYFLRYGRPHFDEMDLVRFYLQEGLHLTIHEFEVDDDEYQGHLFI